MTTKKRASSLPSSSPSRNADNFFVLRIDGEYDQLLENTRKTEIAICLNQVSTSRGRTVKIDFSNEYGSGTIPRAKGRAHVERVLTPPTSPWVSSFHVPRISYTIKGKKSRRVTFTLDSSAPEGGVLEGKADKATVRVPPGQPNTSAPKMIYKPKSKANMSSEKSSGSLSDSKYGQDGAPAWGTSVRTETPSTGYGCVLRPGSS